MGTTIAPKADMACLKAALGPQVKGEDFFVPELAPLPAAAIKRQETLIARKEKLQQKQKDKGTSE